MIIDASQLNQFENRYRAILINSLAGIKQAFLIGTKSLDGNSNVAIFNSLVHIGANPPLWGFICRPDTVQRDTLRNILETGQYTLNMIHKDHSENAHQTSAKYPSNVSEFEACGFTERFVEPFTAPFVEEAPIKIGMKFEEKIDIAINGTLLIIGSIQYIELDEQWLSDDGFIDVAKANTLTCAGLYAYYENKFLHRLSYAKPEKWPSKI
ncbi:MAG: flavin reductase [Flavobacteriia bacterium]|nr:flavin reductase [Flavobacteriia bacterium]NBY39948.1 flavin reductase [Flavobacteriia bacterium]